MRSLSLDVTPVLYLLPETGDVAVCEAPIVQLTPISKIDKNSLLLKRCFDITFAVVTMIFGAPVFVVLCLITKLWSKGPVFYSQERLGRFGKPFTIYKFRSMHIDAEKFGPQLASQDDPRVTKWGRVMRMTRLDELPQFWNVLKGDMSIVGPRPERSHFAKKIIQRNPNYKQLSRIKPGLTSLGQVVFGYAENVDEMCTRMQYDLQYLHNISLQSDLRIIGATIKVMLDRKGK